jgi:hypothetical protein
VALTDDQRAMLRMLARNEEGYEDIAALKGVGVEQVKAEVREALAAAAAEQEAPEAPKPAQPAPPPPPSTPEPPPPTQKSPPPSPLPGKAVTSRKPWRRPVVSIAPERRRFVMVAAGALAVVAVVLILIAVIGGSGDSGSTSTTASAESAASGKLTQAELQPVSGQSGEGRAIFGRIGKEEIVLQVAAKDLEPNARGESYTVWLFRSPKVALRVGAVKVGKSGQLGAQFPIPAELLAYVASGAFTQIYVSRTSDAAYERLVAQAKKQKKLPPYSGETVLRGEITGPIAKK